MGRRAQAHLAVPAESSGARAETAGQELQDRSVAAGVMPACSETAGLEGPEESAHRGQQDQPALAVEPEAPAGSAEPEAAAACCGVTAARAVSAALGGLAAPVGWAHLVHQGWSGPTAVTAGWVSKAARAVSADKAAKAAPVARPPESSEALKAPTAAAAPAA